MTSSPTKKAWTGWNVNPQSVADPPRFLEDALSQDVAERLQRQEDQKFQKTSGTPPKDEETKSVEIEGGATAVIGLDSSLTESDQTTNDLLLAQMLQLEFDKQADLRLQKLQDHYNKGEKIQISFEKFRNIHPSQQEEIYHEDDYEVDENDVLDPVVDLNFGKKGYRGSGKNIVTKHNPELTSKHNASRAMDNFHLCTDTGDAFKQGGVRIPNRVYNNLRVHSKKHNKRAARLHEKKDQSTATQAVDRRTRLELYKMLNIGMLEEVHGVISVGKESAVLHATGGEMDTYNNGRLKLPEECALKVFKTTLSEFKNREKYVKGDYRLANEFSKQNPRKIMKMWAQKEMFNLKRMKKFGIPCPEVLKLRKHILVMQFIGKNQVPACKLKDAKLTDEQACSVYHQIIQGITTLYQKCSLVHADLSEYNLLWYEGVVYFIDVSQSVDLSHPLCHEFLLRDCQNMYHFFQSLGLRDVKSPFQLFNDVTGMNLEQSGFEPEFLQQIQQYEKSQLAYATDTQRKEFAFDMMFERTKGWNKSADEPGECDSTGSEDEESDEDEFEELGEDMLLPRIKEKLSLEKKLHPNETLEKGDDDEETEKE